MGGGGGSKPKPPPVVKPPPPVEEISAATIAPTIIQEQARQQAAGAYTTKGQKLGASGQVLGADPKQLASVAQATGGFKEQKELTLEEYSKQNPVTVKKGMPYQRRMKKKAIEKKQYKDYLKQVRKSNKARKELGQLPSMTI